MDNGIMKRTIDQLNELGNAVAMEKRRKGIAIPKNGINIWEIDLSGILGEDYSGDNDDAILVGRIKPDGFDTETNYF